jgi:hypothetical protein
MTYVMVKDVPSNLDQKISKAANRFGLPRKGDFLKLLAEAYFKQKPAMKSINNILDDIENIVKKFKDKDIQKLPSAREQLKNV